MKILIIDNNRELDSYGSESIAAWVREVAPHGTNIHVRRAPEMDLPPVQDQYDRIVISGSITSCMDDSYWVGELDRYLLAKIEQKTPILGICYGHQSIARALSKKAGIPLPLRKAEAPELGWGKIQIHTETLIFDGLPEEFHSYQSHYEEVSHLPDMLVPLANSDRCTIQAFTMKDHPVWGIQFHPEYTVEDGENSLKEKKAKGDGKWLLNFGKGKKIYDHNVGKMIFGNFINKI